MSGGSYAMWLTPFDPNKKEDFCYIVRGIDTQKLNPQGIRKEIERIENPNTYFQCSLVGKLSKEYAEKNHGISKYIEKLDTMYQEGFILKVPINPKKLDEIIKIAWACDIGSPTSPEELENFVKTHKGKIMSPYKMLTELDDSEGICYNEMIIKGDPEINICGIYYKENYPNSKPYAEALQQIYESVTGEKIPVVGFCPSSYGSYSETSWDKLESFGNFTKKQELFYRFQKGEIFEKIGSGSLYTPTFKLKDDSEIMKRIEEKLGGINIGEILDKIDKKYDWSKFGKL